MDKTSWLLVSSIREHPKGAIIGTWDIAILWLLWYCDVVTFATLITISDNWEPGLMTIFVTWQLIVTLDSIRNSCDVLRICKRCEWQNNIISASLFNYLLCWKKCKFIFPNSFQFRITFASIAKYICPESRIVSSVLSNYLARGRKGEKCANHSKHWKHT